MLESSSLKPAKRKEIANKLEALKEGKKGDLSILDHLEFPWPLYKETDLSLYEDALRREPVEEERLKTNFNVERVLTYKKVMVVLRELFSGIENYDYAGLEDVVEKSMMKRLKAVLQELE